MTIINREYTTWVIVGCGFTGTRLARLLHTGGHELIGTRRTVEACDSTQQEIPGICCVPYTVGDDVDIFPENAVVVLCAPPTASAPAPEQILAENLPTSTRLIYLSTTGVFSHGQGGEVGDEFPLAPSSVRGQRRLQVEGAICAAHRDTVCLRVPSIYGPRRGVHWRMQRDDYRLIGRANTMVSRIYVDDLVNGIVFLANQPVLKHRHYVIGDELPTSSRQLATGIAGVLGLPTPPTVDPQEVSADVRAMLGADRRIVPRRLRALGWQANYRTWREGVAHALQEERET